MSRARTGDHLVAAYLTATGALAAVSGSATGLWLAVAHLAGAAVALSVGRLRPGTPVLRFLRIFYPVLLTPLLYAELATLGQLVVTGYLDGVVQGWEARLFGGQPSLEAARSASSLWLSEILHLGYFSYYLLVPAAALAAYLASGQEGLNRLTVTVSLAFFLCYLCFAVFPVSGPRYEFAGIAGPQREGWIFRLVHAVLETGSSRGTAFPSSHVAAAGAAVLATWRDGRRVFWWLLLPVLLLTAGTVYGRFHYAVDALAGVLVAGLAFAVTPRLVRCVEGPPRARTGAGAPAAGEGGRGAAG